EWLAWGLVAAAGAGALWGLARFWGSSTEYADRWLIVLGSAWLVWRGRDAFARLPARPALYGLLPLAGGAALFPCAWFLAAQVAPKPLLLWWLTAAWVLLAAGLVLTLHGPRRLWAVAFPLAFLFFALPIPNRVRLPLQEVLQEATTTLAAAVLTAL